MSACVEGFEFEAEMAEPAWLRPNQPVNKHPALYTDAPIVKKWSGVNEKQHQGLYIARGSIAAVKSVAPQIVSFRNTSRI
jgi:hypothetical protein